MPQRVRILTLVNRILYRIGPFSYSKMSTEMLNCRCICTGLASILGKIFINANKNARIVDLEQCKLLALISTSCSGNYVESKLTLSAIGSNGHSPGT